MNVIARVDFEHSKFEAAVEQFSPYVTGTAPLVYYVK